MDVTQGENISANGGSGEPSSTSGVEERYVSLLRELKRDGRILRSDMNQPSIQDKPIWFDQGLFENAKLVYSKHFMGSNFASLSGLLLLVRVDSIYQTLNSTGKSESVSKLFKRYFDTLKHVKSWYEGDIFKEGDDAYRSLLIVRGMHNKVSSKFNDRTENLDQNQNYNPDGCVQQTRNGLAEKQPVAVHISQYDIMLTQFAFIGLIVTNPKSVGFIDDFTPKDLESLMHFWRVIGYYLGASDRLNLCSHAMEDILGLCKAIQEDEYRESLTKNDLTQPPGIMSINIVRSAKFIPMLTVYGIMKHSYKILGYETNEIESRRTWFSNFSYTLIDLVMTKLLGYRLFRSFNNGLIRLSIYLVAKVEGWFSNHLESKYGCELKA